MTAPRIRQTSWLLAIAIATFAAVSIATRVGIGVSTDSVAYIAEARQLMNGEGLTLPAGLLDLYADVDPAHEVVATAHFPPVYPLVIALAGLAHDGSSSFRWLNALLLAATALALAVMVERFTSSRWVASFAVGVVVLAPAVLRIHSMAWSEPLFLTLGFSGLLALSGYLEEQRPWMLFAGSATLGLAWLTRYVGIAFVLTGLAALYVGRDRVGRRAAATFLLLSVLPMALYLAAIALADTGDDGFMLLLEPPARAELRAGLESIWRWLRPAHRLSLWGLVTWIPVFVLLYVRFRRSASAPSRHTEAGLRLLPVVLAVFMVVYSAVLLASISVLAEHLPLEERYLVPLYVAAVPLASCLLSRRLGEGTRLRQPLLVVSALLVTATAAAGTTVLDTGTRDFPGFEAGVWRESAAMQAITRLPPWTPIHSNYPEAIYIRTGREARLLPRQRLAGDRPPRHRAVRMARLTEDVSERNGVVVLFTRARRDSLTSPNELASVLGVSPSTEFPDALVYRAPPSQQ